MGTETKKRYWTLEQFAIFLLWVVIFVICGLNRPILRRFEVLTPQQNPPPGLNFLEYVLVRVQNQYGTFLLNFWAICDVYPGGGHFSPFWSHIHPPHPSHLPISIIKLRFVANLFASFHPKVTRRKPDFNEEFGSFLFLIFWILLKWCILEA